MEIKKREWLIALRKERNLKQSDVAELCNLNRSFYTYIELGVRTPSVKRAKKLGLVLEFEWTKIYE